MNPIKKSGPVHSKAPLNPGMSLRDWFAGQASEKDIEAALNWTLNACATELQSRACAKYAYADWMLAVREWHKAKESKP